MAQVDELTRVWLKTWMALNQLEELSADNLEVQVAECDDAQVDEFTTIAEELGGKVDCVWLSQRSTSI